MRVVVMNDHPFIRKGLVWILKTDPLFEWIEEAQNMTKGMQLLKNSSVDAVILDLKIDNECGLEWIKLCRQLGLRTKFIIFTESVQVMDFQQAKSLAVDGYLLKDVLPEEFVHAIKLIHKGRRYYDPDVLDLVEIQENHPNSFHQLTPKEMEVLIELGQGHSNREISERLFISEFTVKKHVSQILSKLDLTDRTQAALYANAQGIVAYAVQ